MYWDYCCVITDIRLCVSVLALKGSWALVLANKAKEEQAVKRNDPSKLLSGPKNQISQGNGGPVNADGKVIVLSSFQRSSAHTKYLLDPIRHIKNTNSTSLGCEKVATN